MAEIVTEKILIAVSQLVPNGGEAKDLVTDDLRTMLAAAAQEFINNAGAVVEVEG